MKISLVCFRLPLFCGNYDSLQTARIQHVVVRVAAQLLPVPSPSAGVHMHVSIIYGHNPAQQDPLTLHWLFCVVVVVVAAAAVH